MREGITGVALVKLLVSSLHRIPIVILIVIIRNGRHEAPFCHVFQAPHHLIDGIPDVHIGTKQVPDHPCLSNDFAFFVHWSGSVRWLKQPQLLELAPHLSSTRRQPCSHKVSAAHVDAPRAPARRESSGVLPPHALPRRGHRAS